MVALQHPNFFTDLTNSDLGLVSLLHTGCNAAKRYENTDYRPAPVQIGHYGQPKELAYTENVRGSSPFAPTKTPPPMRVFA
jgi:hypothetical protein